jgi:hypothetical protein
MATRRPRPRHDDSDAATTTRLAPLACSLGPGRDYGSGLRVVEGCAVAEALRVMRWLRVAWWRWQISRVD